MLSRTYSTFGTRCSSHNITHYQGEIFTDTRVYKQWMAILWWAASQNTYAEFQYAETKPMANCYPFKLGAVRLYKGAVDAIRSNIDRPAIGSPTNEV